VAAGVMAATMAVSADFAYKMISGEPSEFAQHRVPSPSDSAVAGDHTLYRITFDDEASTWSRKLSVDSKQGFAFAFFAQVKGAKVTLKSPNGDAVDLAPHAVEVSYPVADSGATGKLGTQWNFENPTPGLYALEISMPSDLISESRKMRRSRGASGAQPDGVLIVWNESPDTQLFTHTVTMHTVVGQSIGLSARMFDSIATPYSTFMKTKEKPAVSVDSLDAVLDGDFPSGKHISVVMKDDGLGADPTAEDGDYVGTFTATEAGTYRLQAMVSGVSPSGEAFTRSQEHTIVVDEPTVELTGEANAVLDSKNARLRIHLHVKQPSGSRAHSTLYRPYAEVWGLDAAGNEVPVTFAECLAKVENFLLWDYITLEVDLKWLAKAGVSSSSSLSLRGVYVQNADTHVVITMTDKVTLKTVPSSEQLGATETVPAAVAAVDSALAGLIANGYAGEVTRVMREGVAPVRNTTAAVNGKVVLIHGYCASKNPFEVQSSDWTDAVFYDANREGNPVSRSNVEFAEDVMRFIEKEGLGTFSLVGQSQGGMVALHILNYYHTGMDDLTSGRKIQSIATPYLGNSALSNLDLDGVVDGCDPPNDLTREGALGWMTGIAQTNVQLTNVYRTQYDKGGLFGNGWCNQLMNLVLKNPNDGATEVVYSAPETGGQVFDVVKGWCHAEGMNWPPSFWDSTRNKEMSDAAGRK